LPPTNGSAFGQGATVQAGATNAVAIGQSSIATAPNTVSFGTPGNERRLTNVAAGIAPTDAVNVAQLSSVASGVSSQIESQIGGLQSQITHADTGVAMGGGFLPDNKKFALATNYGGFGGQNAVAFTGVARITDNIVLSAAAGYGFDGGSQFGGRAGLQFAW
jgi:autotransporter adhesin